MTKVSIFAKSGEIYKVSALGHTDFSIEGEDIVCSAISSILQTALLGLLQVATINVDFKRDEEQGFLEFTLPEQLSSKSRYDADIILKTMMMGVNDLSENFSKFIKVKLINS